MSDDAGFMRRAIALARDRVGLTGDNPAVGCVLVKDGRVLAEVATAPGGRPHAEEQALEIAGETARGATAYVTLEPCGARSSGAASCTERLVRAGVKRVVVACADPSPLASGHGAELLAAGGVEQETGVLADEAAPLYADYLARFSVAPQDK
ncbi:MAG TPA: bifunctional diaminohydroxyphosphoribosylaminopyrimidine deaminase/5-amino-6-(5-phosphoribosylamino)uracil reductase RibD [Caulobacteraceae bacterium]|jgi:diaminohydroxyphosphoribosylaminopyrimidine deaminase/5-amino-6-(5-phosphoribosylamino)uracil reductase|nr:bifunctional diaminohydroxyphosphoribosylaminopyrimidine deaminase/5-amino-6-(5-phosphoribosylamino)uracil reductase RibD [Caulobacteraceae bacterium]